MANKVKYGLQKVYYAVATDDGTGTLTYATPVAWPGAVSISLAAQSNENIFYADNIAYFQTFANNGYSGDFECAYIPDSFRTAVLGETLDANGAYFEHAGGTNVEFALLFQFEGDDKAIRHAFYRCTASRPDTAGQTTTDTVEPQTETITITALPRVNDHLVKARCPEGATAYSGWYTAVVEPTPAT